MSRYPHIFEPFRCKSLELKNRVVMMPMGTNYGEQTGEMSFLHVHYYEMRAKGGTGLIIMENVCVDHPLGSNGTTQLRIDQDNFIPRLFYFCETIHKQGGKGGGADQPRRSLRDENQNRAAAGVRLGYSK